MDICKLDNTDNGGLTVDELRELICRLDNREGGGIHCISIFSDHSGYLIDNMYDVKLGEFNNYGEMMDLINELL